MILNDEPIQRPASMIRDTTFVAACLNAWLFSREMT